MIGMGWLHALHARSALGRGKLWQAIIMLDDLRDQIIALACARHGLNPWHGREADRLPPAERAALAAARPSEVTSAALYNSMKQLIDLFLAEIEFRDASRATHLREPLNTLVEDAR